MNNPTHRGDSGQSRLNIARAYTLRGWRCVPIKVNEKRPCIPAWQHLRLTEAELPSHFRGRGNIGVLLGEPSDWLVDVDLDHPLAVELADEYLPKTDSEFGRAGKPRSHRLYYVSSPVDPAKWALRRDTLLELRSTGQQTVFPGSVHPSGELVEWASEGDPRIIDQEELLAACEALANTVRQQLSPDAVPPNGHGSPHPAIADDRATALAALAVLNPATLIYDEWLRVGQALERLS